jgi:hypothetical protein
VFPHLRARYPDHHQGFAVSGSPAPFYSPAERDFFGGPPGRRSAAAAAVALSLGHPSLPAPGRLLLPDHRYGFVAAIIASREGEVNQSVGSVTGQGDECINNRIEWAMFDAGEFLTGESYFGVMNIV